MAILRDETKNAIRWPTLFVCVVCYVGVGVSTYFAQDLGYGLACFCLALVLTLYSSFSHEVLHGHPFQSDIANMTLVFPAMGLVIPYLRFRDTHLAHHHDPSLTDPYDDPETNFIDPAVWAGWSWVRRSIYNWNNTLIGRMIIGPVIGLATFYQADARAIIGGDRQVLKAYVLHAAGLVPIGLWLFWVSGMPWWLYAFAVYLSLSILKIRTFLEHRAHEHARCRSVIIEDRGLLSFLFLKNNLHAVHHACPSLPWYKLQDHYTHRKDQFLERNGGYIFDSYGDVARLFLIRGKDPVPHSLWPQGPDVPARQVQSKERLML